MTSERDLAPDPAQSEHVPVLLHEVVDALALQPGMQVIDCTVGGGGHALHILEKIAPDGRLLGLDADPAAIRRVADRLTKQVEQGNLILVQSQFVALQQAARENHFEEVDGILLDLGVSSFQLETPERGFSFMKPGPLDMRFDPDQDLSASDIVNYWEESAIADLIYEYGEERQSRRIARAIVHNRPIRTTEQLVNVITGAVGRRREQRIHPATRTFQALRITVNRELEQLRETLPQSLELLRSGGRLAIISFHSLEDRIVKQWSQAAARNYIHDANHPFGGYEQEPTVRLVTKKPITASKSEIEQNPRSRSAKLRIIERL